MTNYVAAPNDSRYIPFTQQASCCVPTSISMIMYRNGIPLIPIEELGYRLGLTVEPEKSDLFYNVRTSPEPPFVSGYGTQIFVPEYEPNKVFSELSIPLSFQLIPSTEITSVEDMKRRLVDIEKVNQDALLCFNHGVIRGEYEPFTGHVTVFDRMIDGEIRIVDASPKNPKWRTIDADVMYEAIQRHGESNSGGIWLFRKI